MVTTMTKQRSPQPITEKKLLDMLDKQPVYHVDIKDPIESKAQFVEEFDKIVPLGANHGVVNTETAAKIVKLISRYRRINTGKYNEVNIRGMHHKNHLKPLSKEEELRVFGFTVKKKTFYIITDLFALRLGRWVPVPDRVVAQAPKPKRSVGRPRKEEADKASPRTKSAQVRARIQKAQKTQKAIDEAMQKAKEQDELTAVPALPQRHLLDDLRPTPRDIYDELEELPEDEEDTALLAVQGEEEEELPEDE